MSRFTRLRMHRTALNGLLREHPTHFAGSISNRFRFASHARFSSSIDRTKQNALYTSYAKIKAFEGSDQQKDPTLSSQSPSPLLSHLDLLNKDNTLKAIDWTNWDSLREIFNKIIVYYINDFCHDFAYKHANNKIIAQDFIKRTQYMLIKTNMGGKNNRGLLHAVSLMLLRQNQRKPLTATDVHNAFTIALCIEALQSFYLVMDDVVDGSLTRRGQPAWYRFPNVGLKAINDGPIINSWLFWIINNRVIHDGNRALIDRLNALFREVNMLTFCGQATDLELVKDAEKLKEVYTVDRYETIAMYKTCFYTFYLPYAAALYLAGYDDKADAEHSQLRTELDIAGGDEVMDDAFLFHVCRQLSIDMGIKFQIDDDYLDCFGDPEVTGKVGTDIQDFKCSWMVVKALEMVNEEQYERLKRHYGKDNAEDIEQVKQLYDELGVERVYMEWEVQEHHRLMTLVDQCEGILPKEMFTIILDKLHQRKK